MPSQQHTKKCPHCAEEILVEAKKCKHCGEFLNGKPTVIEQTAKRYKAQMLIGGAIMAIGFGVIALQLLIPVDWITPSKTGVVTGALMGILGIIVIAVARISAWWNHG